MNRKDIFDILENCGEKNCHDYNIEMTFPLIGESKQKKLTTEEYSKIRKFFNYDKISVNGFGIYDARTLSEIDEYRNEENSDGNRYYLNFSITEPEITERKSLVTIMMNPAGTFPKSGKYEAEIDQTVKNVIRIACAKKYSDVIILNVSSNINPDSGKWEKNKDFKKEINTTFVKSCLESLCKDKTCDFLAAWGSKEKILKYIGGSCYCEQINKFNSYVYRINEMSQTPAHPGNWNTRKVYNFIINGKELIPCKFEKNGTIKLKEK